MLYETCLYEKTLQIAPGTDCIFQSVLCETYLYVEIPQMLLETVTAAKHSRMSQIMMQLGLWKCLGTVAEQEGHIIVPLKLYDKHMPVFDLLRTTYRCTGVPMRHGNVSSAISQVFQTGSEFLNYAEA